MPKYEIPECYFGRHMHHETIIGLLTGLQLDEICRASPTRSVWYTSDYLQVFQKLGFNTNPRFKPFDPNTEYPCIMRCKRVGEIDGYWYGWIYYDGKVYDTMAGIWNFDDWIETYKTHYQVTSMLQVWI